MAPTETSHFTLARRATAVGVGTALLLAAVVGSGIMAEIEIGIGSALNLRHYSGAVRELYGVDPSTELWTIAQRRLGATPFPVRFLASSAERVPLDDACADTVVMTWTLCSIPDPPRALGEIRRLLKPDGRLIFIEHGRAPDARVRARQDRLAPLWKRIAGGCHLNYPIDELLTTAGFRTTKLERGYASGPKPMTYLYKGVAVSEPTHEPSRQEET